LRDLLLPLRIGRVSLLLLDLASKSSDCLTIQANLV
jgi:hypothetical protein